MENPTPPRDEETKTTWDEPSEELKDGSLRFTPGTMLAGRFRIVAALKRGGMGEVFRAEDTKLNQDVALKFVRGTLSPEALHRLYDEVKIGRQISHPSVCRLYDVVEYAGQTFLAMEYVDGEDLASLLERVGRLAPDKALEVLRDLLAGLAAVHEKGIVHRDLKPANVMIDGHGRPRLTDFGLALTLEASPQGGLAGTPCYMAPEQFEGKATAQTDLYSVGLILFEMLTGMRFYGAKTLEGIRAQHREVKGPRLGSVARLLDPTLEHLIQDCLEESPLARPPSARSVLARLPVSDALEAAVAAGETPSPEIVAAAGRVGDLSPLVAGALLLLTFGAAVVDGRLVRRVSLTEKVFYERSPEILAEHAQDMLVRLGEGQRADFSYSLKWNAAYIDYLSAHDPAPGRFETLKDSPFSPLEFLYRQSPTKLVPSNRDATVESNDPPQNIPGMAEVHLDSRGPLRSFLAVPPWVEAYSARDDPSWAPFFQEAGLDLARFHSVNPEWASPVDSDRKAAWEGSHPARPQIPVRVEAASYHGRPVWFAVLPPWANPTPAGLSREGARSPTPITDTLLWVLALAMPLGGLLLARRNLRLGRGDRKGAFRVAVYVFAVYSLARLCRADHASVASDEVWILIKVLAYPCFWALQIWLLYIALEPLARRQWPQMLIAWKRLLSGRTQDPLVGREVLVGAAAGTSASLLHRLAWIFSPPHFYRIRWAPSSLREALFVPFVDAYSAVLYAMGFLFMLVLLRVLLRNRWLALGAWWLVLSSPVEGEPWALSAPRAVILALVLTRGGLLSFASALYFFFEVNEVPFLLDRSAWYAPSIVLMLAFLWGLALYAFHTSLGGKSILGRALED